MSLASEKVFPTPKGYKGSIRYALIKTKSGAWKIEKRRPFGWKSHTISDDEAALCDTRRKAEKLWFYKDMVGTASWWSKQILHPFYGLEYVLEHIARQRVALDNFAKGSGFKEPL